jgi:hypothetical protein
MTRKSLAVATVGGVLCLGLASCELTGGRGSTPPADPATAARWWAERIEETPPDFLAVYVEAADVHRRQGTAATYVELGGGHTMVGKAGTEVRLPCPPPADVLERMREKAGAARPTGHLLTAEDCRGCSPEEARRIWDEAADRVARKPHGGAVATPEPAKTNDRAPRER